VNQARMEATMSMRALNPDVVPGALAEASADALE
jgi:hypothetical protein